MWRKYTLILASLVFACGLVATSVLRSTILVFEFNQPQTNSLVLGKETVEYYLPYPGMLPDHPLWWAKAARDKLWIFVNSNPVKRAEILLLLADKRIAMSQDLMKRQNPGLAVSTATKAEKYLEDAILEQEEARKRNIDTTGFLQKVATASLKHQELIIALRDSAPEDAKPILNQTLNSPIRVYESAVLQLKQMGRPFPTAKVQN